MIEIEVESNFNRSQRINFINFALSYISNRTSTLKKNYLFSIYYLFSLELEFLIRI